MCAIGFIGVVSAWTAFDRGANYAPATASIFLIDRQCKFDRVHDGGKREIVTQSCNTDGALDKVASGPNGKRAMDVDGKAVVKVSYTAPQDGSYQTSELRFDGRDDEFYKLKAGDEIHILVNNEDTSKIIAA